MSVTANPLHVADRMCAEGERLAAANLLWQAIKLEPTRLDLRRRYNEIVSVLPPNEAKALPPVEKLPAYPMQSEPRLLAILAGCAMMALFASLAASKYFPGTRMLTSIAVVVTSGLFAALLIERWRRRLPLKGRGSVLRYQERPVAYHLCSFALVGFALLFGLGGVLGIVRGG